MRPAVLVAFALTVLPLSLTPGVSSALVATRVLAGGPSEGIKVALGTASGLYAHATMAAAGLAAAVMASSRAFTVIKLAGAAYLVCLGITILRGTRDRPTRPLPWSGQSSYTQALLGNVLNPKAAGVYLTLMPQFIDPARSVVAQTFVLASVHVVVAVSYLVALSCVVGRIHRAVRAASWRRLTQRLAGGVLIGLGVRATVSDA